MDIFRRASRPAAPFRAELPPLDRMRILEIGHIPYFKSVYPAATTFVSTYLEDTRDAPLEGYHLLSWASIATVRRMLREGCFHLVAVHLSRASPFSWSWLRGALLNRRAMRGDIRWQRGLGPLLPLFGASAPLICLDFDDAPFLTPHNERLVARSVATFKRELPTDRWRLLAWRRGRDLPAPQQRMASNGQALVGKFEPLPLGLPLGAVDQLPKAPAAKSVDVFFAGTVQGNSTTRMRSIRELRELAKTGILVDIAERVPVTEFYERCSSAWLVLSPEGLGWDCFRHYEAPACWSVPLISQPVNERYAPLRHGVHALYYDVGRGALAEGVETALKDKARLMRIASAGREHVLAHHTPKAICSYVVERTRERLACDGE